VTRRPLIRTVLLASAFRSSSAATNALDSIYRTPVGVICERASADREDAEPTLRLRLATISVDQFCGGS
jgi:hypothetical protein